MRKHGIRLLLVSGIILMISVVAGVEDITGVILLAILSIPPIFGGEHMNRCCKCKIRYDRNGRPYFIHCNRRYYFDEIWRNGIPATEYQADFRVAKIQYGIEDYAVLEPLAEERRRV